MPEQDELQKDIYYQLVTKWEQTDHKGTWDENDMRNLVTLSSSSDFNREFIERKFSNLGYQVIWAKTSEEQNRKAFDLYGELRREVKIYKSGAQSVSTHLRLYDKNENLMFDDEPHIVCKKLKKGA